MIPCSLDILQWARASNNTMAGTYAAEINNQEGINLLLLWHSRIAPKNVMSLPHTCYHTKKLSHQRQAGQWFQHCHWYNSSFWYLKFFRIFPTLALFYLLILHLTSFEILHCILLSISFLLSWRVDRSYRLPYSICSWWRTSVEFWISFFYFSLRTWDLIDSSLIRIIGSVIYPPVLSTLLYKTKSHQTLSCQVPNPPTWSLYNLWQYFLSQPTTLIVHLINSVIFQGILLI